MNTVIWCCTGIFVLVMLIFFRRAAFFAVRLAMRGILGLAFIFAVNSCYPWMAVGINLYTAVICSVFGFPGAGMLFIISGMIKI